ncbi:hypothetical protein DPMN_177357 [Dreissena polymorpha]|uniref:CID domain-containing protein n=1 Tax=Dreissena polymorpha TaxID=45954 RepID=A0A9D4EAW3_DREPO|nr:hypothetical protein DPMN_177357 [Dreissena polymorpha]
MCFFYRDAGDKQKQSLDRILNIWEERGVYTKDFMKNLKDNLGNKIDVTFWLP